MTLRAGQRLPVSVDTMERIDFARLARKGGSHRPSLTGLGLSVLSRRGLSDAGASCNGAAGYAVFVRRAFSLASRLGACREAFDQNGQHLATTEALLGVSLNMHRDLSPSWSVLIGPELSASYLRQAISGPTPTKGARNVFGGAITVQGGVEFALGAYALTARALAQTYILELQNPGARSPQVSAVFAWGATLGVTRYLR